MGRCAPLENDAFDKETWRKLYEHVKVRLNRFSLQ